METKTLNVLSSIEDLSTDWLSSILSLQVDDYASEEIVGEGYASRMYRLRLKSSAPDAPETLILKLATVQDAQRELMKPDVFCREANFYAGIGKALKDEGMLPVVYFAAADPEQFQLTLLLEDLGAMPHKLWAENLPNSEAAVRALAKIHATYWDADEIKGDGFAPVESELQLDEMIVLLQDNLDVEAAADYDFPYLRDCANHVLKLAHLLVGESDRFHGAMTLVHGDFHSRNIFFGQDRAVVFDWQVTERGRPVRDLIYWMLLCVKVTDIDEFKPRLMELYLSELERHGVRYKKSHFLRDFNESLLQMVTRIYCYQTLITLSEQDADELVNFLSQTEAMAKVHFIRAQLRIARVLAPPIFFVLKLLGKR